MHPPRPLGHEGEAIVPRCFLNLIYCSVDGEVGGTPCITRFRISSHKGIKRESILFQYLEYDTKDGEKISRVGSSVGECA